MFNTTEIILFAFLSFILIIGIFFVKMRKHIKLFIPFVLLLWGILELSGVLTPEVITRFTFGFDVTPELSPVGYPIEIILCSKGGFIANNPIKVKARVYNIKDFLVRNMDAKKLFNKNFDEFDIVWFGSEKYPKEYGTISPTPSIGGVTIDTLTCSGESDIIFTLPGKFEFNILYRKKGGTLIRESVGKNDILGKEFYVSPPEVLVQIKSNNITRGLSNFVLSIALFQMLNIMWKSNGSKTDNKIHRS